MFRASFGLDTAAVIYGVIATLAVVFWQNTFSFLLVVVGLILITGFPVSKIVKIGIGAAILVLVIPIIGLQNTFYLEISTQIGIFAALALGLNIVVGFAGLLDLGYIAFFASGAYLWSILSSPQIASFLNSPGFILPPWTFWFILVIAVVVTAVFGVLLGLPVLKLRGDYLAIVTLGFGEVIRIFANNLDKPLNGTTGLGGLTNGPQGITQIGGAPFSWLSSLLSRFGVVAADIFKYQYVYYYLMVLAVIGLVILVTQRLDHSKIGRAWIAIREDEIAAQAMGVPLVKTKLIAFATGASFAGVMGVIFAARQTTISPENFGFNESIGILAMIVLGGLGSIRGAILGATVLTVLNLQILPDLSNVLNDAKANNVHIFGFNLANLPSQFEPAKYQKLIFGIILILMMIYRPQGLVPAKRRTIELTKETNNITKSV